MELAMFRLRYVPPKKKGKKEKKDKKRVQTISIAPSENVMLCAITI